MTRSAPSDMSDLETAEEYLWAIDAKGRVIGRRSRKSCHQHGITHRAVHVIVLDKRHRIFVKKRSPTKDMFPSQWETSVGGHIRYGDTARETAARELEEELGISEPVRYLGRLVYRGREEKENITMFYVVTGRKLHLNRLEATRGEFLTIDELERCLLRRTFVDGTDKEVCIIKRLLSKLEASCKN